MEIGTSDSKETKGDASLVCVSLRDYSSIRWIFLNIKGLIVTEMFKKSSLITCFFHASYVEKHNDWEGPAWSIRFILI